MWSLNWPLDHSCRHLIPLRPFQCASLPIWSLFLCSPFALLYSTDDFQIFLSLFTASSFTFMSFSSFYPCVWNTSTISVMETLYVLLASRLFQQWLTVIMTNEKNIYVKLGFQIQVCVLTHVCRAALLCWFSLSYKSKTNKYEIDERPRNGLNLVWCTTDFWLNSILVLLWCRVLLFCGTI